MSRLAGRRVLVTGGSRGIGAAVVRRCAAEGAQVAFSYRSDGDSAEALVRELQGQGVEAVAVQANASRREESQRLVGESVEHMGGLDVLVSNAGVEHFAPLADITEDAVDRVLGTNVAGQLWAAQAAAAHLGAGGRIVLTSSVSARMAVTDHALYAASKAAVSAMVRNLAPELGRRSITINAIAAGGTATDMADSNADRYNPPDLRKAGLDPEVLIGLYTAARRLARPEEIAAAVVFLISDEASYVSGSTMEVDGGLM